MEKSFRMWERQLLQPPCSCSSVVAPESAQTQSGWQNSKMFFPNLFKIFHMLGGKPDYLLGPGPGSSSSELGNWRTAFVARSYAFWCPGSITKQATGTLKKKLTFYTLLKRILLDFCFKPVTSLMGLGNWKRDLNRSGDLPALWNLQTLYRIHEQTEFTEKLSPLELVKDPIWGDF